MVWVSGSCIDFLDLFRIPSTWPKNKIPVTKVFLQTDGILDLSDNIKDLSLITKRVFCMIKEIQHPVVLHKLSLLRDKRIKPKQFRELINEITLFLAVQATATLDLTFTKMVILS